METGELIFAIFVQFGHEKFRNIYWFYKKYILLY